MKCYILLSLQILLSLTVHAGDGPDDPQSQHSEAQVIEENTDDSEHNSPTLGLRRELAFSGNPFESDQGINRMQDISSSSTATSSDAIPFESDSSHLSPRREFSETERDSILAQLRILYSTEDSGEREEQVFRIANANDVRILTTESSPQGATKTIDVRPEQQIIFMIYLESGILARIEFHDLRAPRSSGK